MTRPGGITPRGLPYPGSTNIHANTPAALQALAEAITAQLTALPGGLTFDFYAGSASVTNNGVNFAPATFTKLASVSGMIAQIQSGVQAASWLAGGPPNQDGWLMTVCPMRNRQPKFTGTITLFAIGWGPPR